VKVDTLVSLLSSHMSGSETSDKAAGPTVEKSKRCSCCGYSLSVNIGQYMQCR
jgi:hypothetical protein